MLRRVRGDELGFTVDDLRLLAEEAWETVSSLSLSELVEEYVAGDGTRVEPYDYKTWIVYDRETPRILRGWFTPSAIYSYLLCPRMLALDVLYRSRLGGRLVTESALRALVKGRLFHELYGRRLAAGELEVEIEDPRNMIYGFIDEVRRGGRGAVLVELKSGYKVNPEAAALQALAYKLAYESATGERVAEVYVASPAGIYVVEDPERLEPRLYAVIDEVRAIVEEARRGVLPPPPRGAGACGICPYAKYCSSPLTRPRALSDFF